MFRNYIKIALRNILKHKVYSFINITGLVIGLSVSIMIILYVKGELSYDQFHKNHGTIYRMGMKQMRGDKIQSMAVVSPAIAPDLVTEIPEFTDYVTLKPLGKVPLEREGKEYATEKLLLASSSFFDVFSFKILSQYANKPLKDPNSIVLSETLSKKIFGDQNPLGKTFIYQNEKVLTVKAIAENPPAHSHIQYDAILSFSTFSQEKNFLMAWNGNIGYYSYLLANKKLDQSIPNKQITELFYAKLNKIYEEIGWKVEPIFEPLEDVYLKSDLIYDFSTGGNLTNVYIFSAIAFLILMIASINFMNLSTALSLQRIKEVGIRKVTGASRQKIVIQFLGESVFISILAYIGAMIMLETFHPLFQSLLSKEVIIYTKSNIFILTVIPLVVILLGIVSGSYPALHISRFRPVMIIKNSIIKKNGFGIQNALVLIQFIISICLIISSLIIYSQLQYLKTKEVGYNRENLLAIPLYNEMSVKKSDHLRARFKQHNEVINTTVASAFPVNGLTQNGYLPEGESEVMMFHALYVDPYYLETVGLELKEGRNFRLDSEADKEKILVNETLAKHLNWKNPIGKTIQRNSIDYEIIGIVKDFHFESLHNPINPVIFTLKPQKSYVLARISGKNTEETLQFIEKEWQAITGNNVMTYRFLNDFYKRMYRSEDKFGETILFFTFLAIFLACLGLFGLTAIATTQRTKEIGIRKVLGATFLSLNTLLLKQSTKWVLIANIIAWPVAFYFMEKWLQNYAYKITLGISYFIIAGGMAFIISMLTISYLSVRSSLANPVNSLRYE